MKKSSMLLAVILLLLSTSAVKAQTNTSSENEGWTSAAVGAADGITYYIYNEAPKEWTNGYVAQWSKNSGTFTSNGRTYYHATQLALMLVNCDTKQVGTSKLILRDQKGNLIYDYDGKSFDYDLHYVVPGSVEEFIATAICEQITGKYNQ